MRVERKQLENLTEALKYSDAEEFELRVEDGRMRLFAVETVEKLAAVPVTPQGFAQRQRAKSVG